MIVYRSTKSGFRKDMDTGNIDGIIQEAFQQKLHKSTSQKEKDSWWNSLHFMWDVIRDSGIPDNSGIAIECQIPQTSKRIDFIISGLDSSDSTHVVIVELKQWKSAELTDKDGIVRTALGRGLHETAHPSYQAWTYAAMLEDFSETVYEENITL